MGVTADGTAPILKCRNTGVGDNVTQSICFDDFGHALQFYFSLAPGVYRVTFGLGWPGAIRNDAVEYVEVHVVCVCVCVCVQFLLRIFLTHIDFKVNDVILRNFTCSTAPGTCSGVREFTSTVTVKSHGPGGVLIASIGSPYVSAYTFFSYARIVGISAATITSGPTCARPVAPPCAGGTTVAGATTVAATTVAATTVAATTVAATTIAATTVRATTVSAATTVPGATTAPGATVASTTTALGGTTVSPTTGPGGSTMAPTTTARAVGSSTTGATQLPATVPPTSAPKPCPRVCCRFATAAPAGMTTMDVKLNSNFADFDCEGFRLILATKMGIAGSDLYFLDCVSGSVLISVAAAPAAVDSFVDQVRTGTATVPDLASVSANGVTASPPATGLPLWAIILIAVLGAAVVL